MTVPSNAQKNLYKGKGIAYVKLSGETGWRDLGEVSVVTETPEIKKTDFFTNREGIKTKSFSTVDEITLSGSLTLLEGHTKENMELALCSGTPTGGSQAKGTLSMAEITTAPDQFKDTGKLYLYHWRIMHDEPATPFEVGGTVMSNGAGSPVGEVAYVGEGYIEIVGTTNNTTGFAAGDSITDGTSTATISNAAETMGAVVTAAGGATRFIKGVDYTEDPLAGSIRENSGGGIASNTVYVSADYKALNLNILNVLSQKTPTGEFKFIGHNNQGCRWHVWHPLVNFTLDGEVGLITEDNAEVTVSMEIYSMGDIYPGAPYGTWTEVSES